MMWHQSRGRFVVGLGAIALVCLVAAPMPAKEA
jgi:hypothetical protein